MQDVSSMSDAELLAALGQPAAQPQARPQPQPQQTAPMAPQGAGGGNLTAEALFPALVQQESRGRAGAVGPDTQWGNALGRTQMLPATAREMAQRVGVPFDEGMLRGTSPEAAAYQDRLGMAYLQEGFERTGNPREALMYYHGGPDRRLWGPKTRAYADEVLARQQNGDFARVSNAGNPSAEVSGVSGVADLSDDALMAALQQPEAAQTAAVSGASRDSAIDLTGTLYEDQVAALKQGAWVRAANGETYQLPGDAYTAQPDSTAERQSANVFLDRPDMGDKVDAFAQAAGEQIPFLDEAAAGVAGMTTGRGYGAMRDQQDLSRRLQNQTERGSRVAGGLAGFGLGLAAPGGSYINGATGLARIGRAAQVGAGYGAAYGAGNTEGDLGDRLAAGGSQAALGAFGGAAFQRGADVLGAVASRARANPSASRQLSAAGVDLTPGQMIGGAARRIEDGLQSVPIMGDGIRDARRRGLETFNSAAINEAIRPVGQVQNTGRVGLSEAGTTVSGAYDNALTGVPVPRDGALDASLTAAARINPLPPELQSSFGALLNNWNRRFGQGMAGPEWKQLDSEIGAAIRSAQSGSATNPAQRLLADKLIQTREAFQGALERADPQAFAAVRQADTANAGLTRIRDAGQSLGTAARDGIFTPGDLNRAVRNGDSSAGNRQYAQGSALLQQLSDNAASVLPSTVPDSGTPFRSLLAVGGIGGGAAATTGGAAAIPAMVTTAGLFGGGAAYGRGVQGILNRAYRASTPGAARQALADLQAAAARSPALQPVYEALQSSLLPLLRGEPTQGSTPALSGSPR